MRIKGGTFTFRSPGSVVRLERRENITCLIKRNKIRGFQSTAKVTVRDRAGNVKTVSFGNADGSFTKRVIIKKTDDSTGKLYVTYSMVASEYTKRIYDLKYDIVCYLSAYGAQACTELPEQVIGD